MTRRGARVARDSRAPSWGLQVVLGYPPDTN
jgi:hypothetical protein